MHKADKLTSTWTTTLIENNGSAQELTLCIQARLQTWSDSQMVPSLFCASTYLQICSDNTNIRVARPESPSSRWFCLVAKMLIQESVFTPEVMMHTTVLRVYLIRSSRITMDTKRMRTTLATWITPNWTAQNLLKRRKAIFSQPVSELAETSLISLWDQESRKIKETKSRNTLWPLWTNSKENLKVNTTLLDPCRKEIDSNLLMTISFSKRVTDSFKLPVWIGSGQLEEVSSIMTPRLSLSGSMKKISWELSPWRRAQIFWLSSQDCLRLRPLLRRRPDLLMTTTLVTSLHAQQTSVLLLEPLFTSSSHCLESTRPCSIESLTDISFKSEVSMVSTPRLMMAFSTSPTEDALEDLRLTWFKTCTMVSRQWSKQNSLSPWTRTTISSFLSRICLMTWSNMRLMWHHLLSLNSTWARRMRLPSM